MTRIKALSRLSTIKHKTGLCSLRFKYCRATFICIATHKVTFFKR
ncbi:unnamed protein product [Schistosoma mattheei]|uniref:Uncharacterized protein n=1 Tax=Schistosoma mattheei TaxID=31246 RepID=A0A183NN64_9TREM|nr:unnamed protein product [Schistosoma mattheei]